MYLGCCLTLPPPHLFSMLGLLSVLCSGGGTTHYGNVSKKKIEFLHQVLNSLEKMELQAKWNEELQVIEKKYKNKMEELVKKYNSHMNDLV